MSNVIGFILEKAPVGIIAFDQKMEIIFWNREAEKFFRRHRLPDDITDLCRRIFDSIANPGSKDPCPGDIYLHKKLDDSPCGWTFRVNICEKPEPFICIYITEETVSNKLDLNKIRNKFNLTRREADVLRRALNGLKNIEIAEDLDISEQTIKDHLSNIYMKTGVKNRFELISSLLTSHNTSI